MKSKVDLYSGTYQNYAEDVYKGVRKDTYGEDIGQNSWITAEEYRGFFSLLQLSPDKRVLEIATGSGGPAVFTVKETGCHLVGIDIDEHGVSNAKKLAQENGLTDKMEFLQADAQEPLPFSDGSFDVIICMDSIIHFKDRGRVLKECCRVLKNGGQLLYTDPTVITGMVSNEEIAIRGSIGFFLFVLMGQNEQLLTEAGFKDINSTDVTDNIVSVSLKWHDARENKKHDLLQIEQEETFNGLQSFFKMVHLLTSERRLSRLLFAATK